MQAIKSLFRRTAKQTAQIVPAAEKNQGPTPLSPADLKFVAGGLPRVGGLGTDGVQQSTLS